MERPPLVGSLAGCCVLAVGVAVAGCDTVSSARNDGGMRDSGLGGGAGTGGMGGTGGMAASGGAGGTAGSGGNGGTMLPLEVCQAWCQNEPNGRTCCNHSVCLEGCYELCEDTVTDQMCQAEWLAERQCHLAESCDDFFKVCALEEGRHQGCLFAEEARASGTCANVASGCDISEEECLSTFEEAVSVDCAHGWRNYVDCGKREDLSCGHCYDQASSLGECTFPQGAAVAIEFIPKDCGTLALPPTGCLDPCPNNTHGECALRTHCDARVCTAECVTNGDCARGYSCSVRGRCLRTRFGTPIECAELEDPPEGCGARCDVDSCPEGTHCRSPVCDAECSSNQPCEEGEFCGPDGRCGISTCSAGRTVDPALATAATPITCDLAGILDIFMNVELNAKPTARLQTGTNTFDIQPVLRITEPSVNMLLTILSEVRLVAASATVSPTLGSTTAISTPIAQSPAPCRESLRADTEVEIIFPASEGSWDLDDGTTQELTLESLSGTVVLVFDVDLSTSPGGDCVWLGEPPKVSFTVP